MDSKRVTDRQPVPPSRWFAYLRSTAAYLLRSAREAPFENGLKLHSLIAPLPKSKLPEPEGQLSKAS
jgi:hypothetical protein